MATTGDKDQDKRAIRQQIRGKALHFFHSFYAPVFDGVKLFSVNCVKTRFLHKPDVIF